MKSRELGPKSGYAKTPWHVATDRAPRVIKDNSHISGSLRHNLGSRSLSDGEKGQYFVSKNWRLRPSPVPSSNDERLAAHSPR